MMKYSARRVLAIAIATTLIAGPIASVAAAEEVPSDPQSFTNYVASAFAKAWPGLKVTVKAPLALEIKTPDSIDHLAYLQTIYGYCLRLAQQCAGAVANHVRQLISDYQQPDVAPDKAKLRAVLRPSAYVDQMRRMQVDKGEPVAVPFLAGLWVICMLDMPETMRTVTPTEIAALGLSRDEAVAVARANVAASLRPLQSMLQKIPVGGIGTIRGDPYESSRLLFPEVWRAAFPLNKRILVAISGADMVLWTIPKDEKSVDDLQTAARLAQDRGLVFRSLSTTVFRLTETGWEVASR